MKLIAASTVLLLCAVSNANAVDVVKGCYQKNGGQVRVLIQGYCSASELPITLATGEAAGNLNPDVYDANGQYLGTSLGDAIYLPALQKYAMLLPSGKVADVEVVSGLYYTDAGCAGQPYIVTDWGGGPGGVVSAFMTSYIFKSSGKYFALGDFAAPGQAVKSIAVDGTCNTVPEEPLPEGVYLAVEVTLPFTTPVALPLQWAGPTVGKAKR